MSHILHPELSNSPFWAAEIITHRTKGFKPRLAIILGSGLGKVADQIKKSITIPYSDLPLFSVSKIQGHSGQLRLGMLNGVPVVCLEGRTHTYEGEPSFAVIRNIVRTLKLIGCEILLTTCSVGSLKKESGPGSLVLMKDHINFMFSNILIGQNDERFGERFVSMDNVYDLALRKKILAVAKKMQISLPEGIHLSASGPTFETHAEISAYKTLGADTVGMSNVPEVIAARHTGMKVATICAVVNLAAGLTDEVLSHEGTIKGANLAIKNLSSLILNFVTSLASKK
ncbi:MAG: purine-nucleoside phosphorylase [Gammaproteobacteria bacterium]|jgi:xanthosine phosphorylase